MDQPTPLSMPGAERRSIDQILELLGHHQQRFEDSVYLVPSENVLSPLARLPLVLDAYNRYFFAAERTFGAWKFPGGIELGQIEHELLLPALRRLARSAHVDVRSLSGMHCLTMVLAGLTAVGDRVLSVPYAMGGHPATTPIAARFGLRREDIPMVDPRRIDLDALAQVLRRDRPALIYFDQASGLFPLDPAPVRELIDRHHPEGILHYDSSHLNGLILAGAVLHPLDRGAHCFGGSTHKTLPGPHKGFFATNDAQLFARFEAGGGPFVSHCHMAETVSLAITLEELVHCDGRAYAERTIDNARALGSALAARGLTVAGGDAGYTGCHQLWVTPPGDAMAHSQRLHRLGLLVNALPWLPGVERPSFRLSLSELTKRGLALDEIDLLADLLVDALDPAHPDPVLHRRVSMFAARHREPRYCFRLDALGDLPPSLEGLIGALLDRRRGDHAR